MTAEDGARLYSAQDLRDFGGAMLRKQGVPPDAAIVAARSLVDANLRGVDTHGIARLPVYSKRLSLGLVNPAPNVRVIAETPTTVLVEGDHGLGQVVSDFAIRQTVDHARVHGMCCTTIRNSTHNGTQAHWALQGAHAGLLTLAFTNGEALVAPWGGRDRFVSTNPICIAVPSEPPDELVLDMATTQVAGGHVLLALSRGESIPSGWLLDAEGQDSNSPQDFMEGGSLAPLGGYKGAGLSLMIQVLTGVLAGGPPVHEIGSMYWTMDQPQRISHTFLALEIERFIPLGEFKERVGEMLKAMRSGRKRPGVESIFAPGDIERLNAAQRVRHGCPLTSDIENELRTLADEHQVPFPDPLDARA